ncbi:helix-turn-helix domain-containing protein [Sinorhizobium meliloti]|nr:helix-turn-helix domain-containing protein [Sinorhizobium meliloti]
MSEAAEDGVSKHTIPVIDRMMDVLCEIERKDRGLSISELTEALKLPRTTIYRILNSLQQHDIVYRDDTGSYHLGRRLLSLAAHVGVRRRSSTLPPSASRISTSWPPNWARGSS